jgi:UDP-N-acetyl-D-mannosaminuronic acid dehydrogenase
MEECKLKRISVIGLGYIGLPTAAVFANHNINVIGVDTNPGVVEIINSGKIHIIEPQLDEIVKRSVENGFLRATNKVEPSDIFIIAVPTPTDDFNEPDIGFVTQAVLDISVVLEKGNLIILESTCPPGTTKSILKLLVKSRPDLKMPNNLFDKSDIHFAYCPERVLPGNILHEIVHNDRVIGGTTPKCSELAKQTYEIISTGECIISSSPEIAELSKLAENSFRDVNIAFANELSMLCDKLSVNVWELIKLANRHPRVNILRPGPGVGGHCIAVDPWFLVNGNEELTKVIKSARIQNKAKTQHVLDTIEREIDQSRSSRVGGQLKIAILGLTFKPDVDDIRESPALEITLNLIQKMKNELFIYDPLLDHCPSQLPKDYFLTEAEYNSSSFDLQILLVGHSHFKGNINNSGRLLDFVGLNK